MPELEDMYGPRNPPTGPLMGGGAGGACAAAQFAVDGGAGTALVNLGDALAKLGNPVGTTFFATLNIVSIRDVDGEFPVAETHPIVLWVDADGLVQMSATVDGFDDNITNPAAATAEVQGGTASFAQSDSNVSMTVTVTGTDRNVTVTYEPPLGTLHSGSCEICLGVGHPAIPA